MKITLIIVCALLFPLTDLCGQGSEVLSPEAISKLVPRKIKGYHVDGSSKSKLIAFGEIRYSLTEQNFASGKQRVKILLFDYVQAQVMYNQTTRRWHNYEPITNDSLVFQSVAIDNTSGWESFDVKTNNSQIVLGIGERFLLTIEGKQVPLAALKDILLLFKFDTFPK